MAILIRGRRQPAQSLIEYAVLIAVVVALAVGGAFAASGAVNDLISENIAGVAGDTSTPAGGDGPSGGLITGTSPQPGTGGPLAASLTPLIVTYVGDGTVRVQATADVSGGTFVQFGWHVYGGEFSLTGSTTVIDFEMSCADLAPWWGNAPVVGVGATDYPNEDAWMMAVGMQGSASDEEQLPLAAEVAGCEA